uniref:Uncharacterized protein n=1 Tax=Acidicaldus sp. TaxID=1872105 RepID=A0A8J4HAC8_9PROT
MKLAISREGDQRRGRPRTRPRQPLAGGADPALHEAFKRRIKTQTALPSAGTAALLFWSLLASGQITMRPDHHAPR